MRQKVRSLMLASVGVFALGAGIWNARRVRATEACGPECEAHHDVPVACNLRAFTPEERRAHEIEGASLMRQALSKRELADGFELRLPTSIATNAAHWFVDERRCCPFLSFELRLSAGEDEFAMLLRGPEGTKEILRPIVIPK